MEKVRPFITKQTTKFRLPISPEEKLAVTLRYMATGESFRSLMYQFRIHRSTIEQFIEPVCAAIYKVMAPDYMKVPNSENEWLDIIEKTKERWQFPNCFAAADGKHIGILCPQRSGSEYYNYKGFFSIVLLAFVDYDYKFLIAEVGCQGRISDGDVYRNYNFFKALKQNKLNLPHPQELPKNSDLFWSSVSNNEEKIPMVFVADDAFPLDIHTMKPYVQKGLTDEKRVYNYRLSRFSRISENAFGIWINRFRLFATRASLTPEKAETVVMASLALHNMLHTKSSESYTPGGFIDQEGESGEVLPGNWRQDSAAPNMVDLQIHPPHRKNISAENIRTKFLEHFNGPGQVPWQWNVLLK